MTHAQAAWLRKLKDEGPQSTFPPAGISRDAIMREWADMLDEYDFITPAGIAALQAYERNKE